MNSKSWMLNPYCFKYCQKITIKKNTYVVDEPMNKHYFLVIIFSFTRWEDGLVNRLQYDVGGNIQTQVVRSPFVQVRAEYKMFFLLPIFLNTCEYIFLDSSGCN